MLLAVGQSRTRDIMVLDTDDFVIESINYRDLKAELNNGLKIGNPKFNLLSIIKYISPSYFSDILSYVIQGLNMHILWRDHYFFIETTLDYIRVNGKYAYIAEFMDYNLELERMISIGHTGQESLYLGFFENYNFIRLGLKSVSCRRKRIYVPMVNMTQSSFKKLATLKDLNSSLVPFNESTV